ncbi:hypothetical protein NDU88_002237 [Pleurodeles waltl]|uniref:Uncharacterized protein n=1 Tax=Pleurodeles waltl TaxID=8319 RepID=A0AAV7KV33_PLEWA|nr:hypothetical protein NDU88_002237 [Pleurodeles waltl]
MHIGRSCSDVHTRIRSTAGMKDDHVPVALRLLQETGRMDLVHKGVIKHLRPASGVMVAVLACLPSRRVWGGGQAVRLGSWGKSGEGVSWQREGGGANKRLPRLQM